MFSNHFTTNFSQIASVKKFWQLVNIWHRCGQNCGLLFWATLYIRTVW